MIFLSLANYHIYTPPPPQSIEPVDNSESSSHLSSPCKNTAPLQS